MGEANIACQQVVEEEKREKNDKNQENERENKRSHNFYIALS